MKELQNALGYKFRDPSLLKLALTHRSFAQKTNERLEFLGDAVLNAIISDYLYEHFPQTQEGRLSQIRSNLVNKKTLVEIAIAMNLIRDILHAQVIKKDNLSKEHPSLLANATEAIIGAVYLDGGWDSCKKIVFNLYQTKLQEIDADASYKDSKTQLQELTQMKYGQLPVYKLLSAEGEGHKKLFTICCELPQEKQYIGEGHTIKVAEKMAADKALNDISK